MVVIVLVAVPVAVVLVAAAGNRAGRFHKVSKDSCCRYTVGRVTRDDDEGCGIANNYAIVGGGCVCLCVAGCVGVCIPVGRWVGKPSRMMMHMKWTQGT